MKAVLTSYSENVGYNINSFGGPSVDAVFVANLPSKFHHSTVSLRFENLDYGALGISRENVGSDEWELEIKLIRKPKPQSQTFHFK